MLTKKYGRNLNRVLKLNESDKYCWARLESIAHAHSGEKRLDSYDAYHMKDAATSTTTCKREGDEIGSCWCGKFRRSV